MSQGWGTAPDPPIWGEPDEFEENPLQVALYGWTLAPPPARHKEITVDRNNSVRIQTLKSSREGRKTGREPKANPQKPTEMQEPCPNLRGTFSNALTVMTHS